VSGRSPLARPRWLLRALRTPRRPQSLTVLLLLAACVGLLLWFARGMDSYGENLASTWAPTSSAWSSPSS
jgi:hypothetical protein